MSEILIPSEQDIYLLRHKTASQSAVSPTGTHLSLFLGTYIDGKVKNTPAPYLLSTENGKDLPMIHGTQFVKTLITSNRDTKQIGIRPMMNISDIPAHIKIPSYFDKECNCQVVEYGFYPQTCINHHGDNEVTKELNLLYKQKKGLTGRFYTFNYHSPLNDTSWFYPKEFDEYQLDDNYYIRIQPNFENYKQRISKYHKFWIKVEPIQWLHNQKTGNLIAKNVLLSGIAMNTLLGVGYHSRAFKFTQIYQYLNKYFKEEITQHDELIQLKELSLTDYKNMIVQEFRESAQTTYKDNRVKFYQDFFAKTRQFTQQITDNSKFQDEVNIFAKEFVRYIMRHQDLTPAYAISQLALEVAEEIDKQPTRYPQKITRQRFKPTLTQRLTKYYSLV